MNEKLAFIKEHIASIPDYPKPGVIFRDVTTLIDDPEAFAMSIELLAEPFLNAGITKVVGTEARGFIFGAPLALKLGVGFVPVRKPGKLPRAVYQQHYELEYGRDTLEIHKDAISSGDRVLMVDDLLATGGTLDATVRLIRLCGGQVDHAAFVIGLPDLGGFEKLAALGVKSHYLVEYAGD